MCALQIKDELRSAILGIATLLVGVIITYIVEINLSLGASVILSAVISILFILYFGYDGLYEQYREWKHIKKIKTPSIAIINEDGCESAYTKFKPHDWYNFFNDKKYKTSYIRVDRISNKFTVIINPYGEVYPEQELVNRTTLKKIKEYVDEGGIFVNAGGHPFFWGWDTTYKERQVLAKEIETYSIKGNALEPSLMLNKASLIDTPLFDLFHILCTIDDSIISVVYQNPEDTKVAGKLTVTEKDEFEVYRAVRRPALQCMPFIRSKWHNNSQECYPIASIRSGRGHLIVAGINLESKRGDDFNKWQFDKINTSVINFIEYLKKTN